jgi:hypothetical protein
MQGFISVAQGPEALEEIIVGALLAFVAVVLPGFLLFQVKPSYLLRRGCSHELRGVNPYLYRGLGIIFLGHGFHLRQRDQTILIALVERGEIF